MRSVSLRPYDARAIGRKRLTGILETLNLETGTVVTSIPKSEMECFYKQVLRRDVGASVNETATYFK